MAAFYESKLHCTLSEDKIDTLIFECLSNLVASSEFSHIDNENHSIKTGINLYTWGEKITILKDSKNFQIISKCTFPLQIVAWGKNKRNVKKVKNQLAQLIDR